jgi:hypothetical protein
LGWFDRAGGQNNAEEGINDLLIHDHLHYTFASLEKREINLLDIPLLNSQGPWILETWEESFPFSLKHFSQPFQPLRSTGDSGIYYFV